MALQGADQGRPGVLRLLLPPRTVHQFRHGPRRQVNLRLFGHLFKGFRVKFILFLKMKMRLNGLLVLKICNMLEIGLLSYFRIRIWFF